MKVNDNKIINYIKFLPFYFLIATTIIFAIYIFISNHYKESNEKKELKINLENKYNEKIKTETEKIVNYINQLKSKKEEETINLLKSKSDTAYSIIDSIYKKNKNKSKEEILTLIKNSLQDIRYFDGRGYYYIIDTKTGYCYFHPIFKQLENKSLLHMQDANGLYLTKEMIKVLKDKQEGHVKYSWYKQSDQENQYEKIAYLRKYESLGFYFVISDYIDSINNELKEEVKTFLQSVNFNDESTYFIIDKNSLRFEFHSNKALINKNINEIEYFVNIKDQLENLEKKPNDFHEYYVIERNKELLKKSYIQTITDWDWIIGFGYFENDIIDIININLANLEEYHKHTQIITFIFMLIVAIIVLLVSRYFSKIIERRFKTYNFSINRKIVEIGRQQRVLAQQTKMAAMGEMIENIAHQWRQPLSIISTCSTGLKLSKEYGTLDDEMFYSNVKSINESAQYLSTTIDDFRNFYEKSNEEKEFRIDEVIFKSTHLLKTKIDSMQIIIEQNIKKLSYTGYENELLQVILNLMKNSIDQFVNLKEENFTPKITIDVYKNENGIFIEFLDNAGGINPDIIDRIFEPYFTTKNKSIGTGIGLYMSRNIIEKHFNGSMIAKNIIVKENNKNYKCAKFIINIKN